MTATKTRRKAARCCAWLPPWPTCFALYLRKRAGPKVAVLATLAVAYVVLTSTDSVGRRVASPASPRRTPPTPAGKSAGTGAAAGAAAPEERRDPLAGHDQQWSVIDLDRPAHSELLERPSAYREDLFVDARTRRPLYDPDYHPAAQIAIGDFPWVGTSLTEREKRKTKPPRRLGSILGPMPDWEVYPNPSTLDTLASVPNVTSWRYAAREEPPVAGHPPRLLPVSAVLVRAAGETVQSLRLIIQYLAKYPYFREVLVWNNDPASEISEEDLRIPGSELHPATRVFNSSANFEGFAKYLACNMAAFGACYFQDAKWLNTHMDAMYTSYIRFPHLVHAAAEHISLALDRRWTFTGPPNLHTGFAPLDQGAFVPKSAVNRFLRQTGWTGLPREQLTRADAYFTVWMNQYPLRLEGSLVTPKREVTMQPTSRNPEYVLDAARILERTLSLDPQNFRQDPFLRNELGTWNERTSRASCRNDACVFLTSVDNLPAPSSVRFAPDVSSIAEHERKFRIPPTFGDRRSSFSFYAAVDGDETTCWNSRRALVAGDYFGLHFVVPRPVESFAVYGSVQALDRDVAAEVSIDGINWNTCDHIGQNDGRSTIMELDCEDSAYDTDDRKPELFAFLRVVARRDLAAPLEICSMKVDEIVL